MYITNIYEYIYMYKEGNPLILIAWMDLLNIVLSERSQAQKGRYHRRGRVL